MDSSQCHLLNVYLDLSDLGLGMSIRGGIDSADARGNTQVYISKILEGGAVQQDGRLRIGDILLEVNGVSLEDITHKEVVQAIMKAAPYIHLYVKRLKKEQEGGGESRRGANHQEDEDEDEDEEEDEPLMGDRDDQPRTRRAAGSRVNRTGLAFVNSSTSTDFTSSSSSLISVPLTRDEHNGFGFSLTGGVGNQLAPNDPAIYVSKLVHDGPAHRSGLLQVGDQIVAVNGTQLGRVPYHWALQLIRSSPQSSTFTVKKALTWD